MFDFGVEVKEIQPTLNSERVVVERRGEGSRED